MTLTDFTRKDADLDSLWREYQATQAKVTLTRSAADTAFSRWELLREHQELTEKYAKLFGGMLKALLDANDEDKKNKIRNHYSIKLQSIFNRLKAVEGRVNGNVPLDVPLGNSVPGSSFGASLAQVAGAVPGPADVLAALSKTAQDIKNIGKSAGIAVDVPDNLVPPLTDNDKIPG